MLFLANASIFWQWHEPFKKLIEFFFKFAEPDDRFTCLICVEGVIRVLEDLIRAALQEAAEKCKFPEEVDQLLWSRIIQGGEPGSGGKPNG